MTDEQQLLDGVKHLITELEETQRMLSRVWLLRIFSSQAKKKQFDEIEVWTAQTLETYRGIAAVLEGHSRD